ncbi:hypothetical protein GC197_03990 [bacterium]|nr:hypothetical protein [bacterium]
MNTARRVPGSVWTGPSQPGWSRASGYILAALLVAGYFGFGSSAFAQVTPGPAKIEERGPEIFYLPMKDGSISEGGKLERIIDFPTEAFRDWYNEVYLNRNPKDLPKYSMESVKADIETHDSSVLLHVTYQVIPHASGWVRIPLGLQNAILRDEIKSTPVMSVRPEQPVTYTANAGYAVWCKFPPMNKVLLSPEDPKPVTLEVTALLGLTTRGDETSLETSLPADTKCQVAIDIPQPGALVSHKGNMVIKDPMRTAPEGHSQQLLEFAGGGLGLSWRFDEQAMSQQPVILKVHGQLTATVESEKTVRTVARLQVESTTIAFDSFQIEIDEDAEFVPPSTPPAGYTIRPLDPDGTTFNNRLLVELSEETKQPVSVTITTQQTDLVPGDRDKRQFTIGQFNVLGSDIQDGILNIQSAGNVHVTWDTPQEMREQNSRTSEGVNYRASFAYDRQPAALTLHTLPIQSTARVKSDYELFVGKVDAQLVAKFSYRLPRTYTDDLVVNLNGWAVDRVDSQGAAQWQAAEGDTDDLVLPLTAETGAEAMSAAPYRTIEVTLRAHRDHASQDATEISLPWLIPRAEPLGSATVIAVPNNDLEIRFQPEKSQGFQLDRSRSQEVELTGERGTIVLRASPNDKKLTLGMQLLPVVPRLIIGSRAEVKLAEGDDHAHIKQQFDYEPFHSAPDKAIFRLPSSIYFFDVTAAKINGEDVIGQKVQQGTTPTMEYPLTEVSPPYHIELEYTTPLAESLPETGNYQIELMTPTAEQLTPQGVDVDFKPLELTFVAAHDVEVLSKTDDWQSMDHEEEGQTFRLPGSDAGVIRFSAPFLTPEKDDRVVVDFHWLQVALTPDERRDRAAFTLRTSSPKLHVTMPEGVRHVEVYFNGIETQYSQNGRQLEFEIPDRTESGRDRLELWYTYEPGDGMQSSLLVNSPQIENAVLGTSQPGREGGYSYLQVVTPGIWMVLSASNLSEEMNWSWNNGRYVRTPRLTQSQLQTMAKSNATKSELPPGMNRALYSTIGPFENVRVSSAKVSYLILLFSGAALAGLLGLFYLPQARHPLVFGTGAILALAAAVAYPDFTVLLGEMSSLGIMLAIVGVLLYRFASYRAPVKSAVRARASSDSQASVPSVSQSAAAPGASGVSTASMPAAVPSSGHSR